MNLQFYLRYHTHFGQSLWVSANLEELGNGDPAKALPMVYLNDEFWTANLDIRKKDLPERTWYKYYLKDEAGVLMAEWAQDRYLDIGGKNTTELQLIDSWNYAGEFENAFFTAPFNRVLLKQPRPKSKSGSDKNPSHIFRVKAPLLKKNQVLCFTGSGGKLGDWETDQPLLMKKEDGDSHWWSIKLDLSDQVLPMAYKYGIYQVQEKNFLQFENGDNRLLQNEGSRKKQVLIHDGFARFTNDNWKGAGLAIPVFSLRSEESFGVGEFSDLKLLVDWARSTGLKLVQILPVNDTMSNFSWKDSYPYSAISAFALHPLYINLWKVAGKNFKSKLSSLYNKQEELNALMEVDYEEVMKIKWVVLEQLYDEMGTECLASEEYLLFFNENKHWLEPYAAFCHLRDKYGNAEFSKWATNSQYDRMTIEKLCSARSTIRKKIAFYYFVQYHLHLQLQEAVDYAHKRGVVIKGDIPIGISCHSCDAWVNPEMYNMEWQAGAPPDDFAAVGQNWGFPTYNWKKMQEDKFSWWKQRFEQMSRYFDAFRIDHILGFFRIWSIPAHAIQGIMGRFVPCLPVHINEFGEKGIWFDYQRYCRPFVNDQVLEEIFQGEDNEVRETFFVTNKFDGYDLRPEFNTQAAIETYFATLEQHEKNERLKQGLFTLLANVILFEEEGSQGEKYHFRIAMDKTISFRYLDEISKQKLKDLYVDYFFRRQDDFWYREAMHRLPQLKGATNMLVCGEDLGMVPHCVPDVMNQLGILSLEIQRMPKDPKKEFFHPDDAPYMSVITPSTHDMSTIRGWWEENREKTRRFYNEILSQWGEAPVYCEAWINRAIVLQHLYSPAMWSIFQLQDIFGMSEKLRRSDPQQERINNPANPKHYWQYRMHMTLEDLMKEEEFNEELKGYVMNSGR